MMPTDDLAAAVLAEIERLEKAGIGQILESMPATRACIRALAQMDGHMSDCAYVRLSARGAVWCACDCGKTERDKALREFAGKEPR